MKETVITVDSSCDMLLEDCKKINVFPIKLKYSIDNVVYEDSMNEEKQKILYDKMQKRHYAENQPDKCRRIC